MCLGLAVWAVVCVCIGGTVSVHEVVPYQGAILLLSVILKGKPVLGICFASHLGIHHFLFSKTYENVLSFKYPNV